MPVWKRRSLVLAPKSCAVFWGDTLLERERSSAANLYDACDLSIHLGRSSSGLVTLVTDYSTRFSKSASSSCRDAHLLGKRGPACSAEERLGGPGCECDRNSLVFFTLRTSLAEFVENDEMMGDPGTSDTSDPELYRRWSGSCFPDPAMVPHEQSASSSAIDLHGQPPPDFQFPLFHVDHHRAASFRHDGSEELRNQASQPASGSLIGHFNRTDGSESLMKSARVSEDVLLTYPSGECDAVSITTTDVEGLGPGKLVSDNIIDFYIKHLNREIVSRDSKKQRRIHFLSSFFFTKFLKSTEFGDRILREDDYVKLQKWIGDAKLFEKDYIFIPVVQRSHWSLIVICHLARLVRNARGEMDGSPCILHLDPMKGVHGCFEGQVKGFLHHAYLTTMQGGCHLDVLHRLNGMKHVQAEVPQQGNKYDCGMYILHYIEVFLSKWTSGDPSFPSCQGDDQFTNPIFGMKVLEKRSRIQSLIVELSGRTQELDSNPSNFQEKPQEDVAVVQELRPQRSCLRSRAKETKSKKFTPEETSVLLQCMLNTGRFSIKDKQGCMHWDRICQEINKYNGERSRSNDECRRRFDTLLKAYKKLDIFCGMNKKTFGEITDVEKDSMNLATPLTKAWFNDLRAICSQRASSKGKAAKRQKLKCDGDIDINKPESQLDLAVQKPMPLEPTGSVLPKKAASKQVTIPRFGALDIELQCTLLNMIQACSMNGWKEHPNMWKLYLEQEIEKSGIGMLEAICRMLAIVQDQTPLEIRKHVYELRDLELVTILDYSRNVKDMDEWKDYQAISLSRLKVFKKFGEKVLRKNPHLRTFQIACGGVFVTTVFPLQHLRALILSNCQELEHVDLGNFPELRFLHIHWCENLKSVGGWEVVHKLGWIEINRCKLYCEFPIVQCFLSLKEFTFVDDLYDKNKDWQSVDFSKCVLLQRLCLTEYTNLVESMELGALKFLEFLSFQGCGYLSTIHGLKGLHALAKLDLSFCYTLRRVPELGCLKALTHLDMSWSGIVEIPGVELLQLLTSLNLSFCKSLESLPFLGQLKALAHLNLSETSIQELFGVEDLINLKTLDCQGSELLKLPKLEHLPHLQNVDIRDTPLFKEMHPSKPLCWNNPLNHSSQDKGIIFVDNVSDVSLTSDVSSNVSSSSED